MEYFLNHRLVALTLLIQLIALPIILILTHQQQVSQGKAANETTLSLTPVTTITSPNNVFKDEYFSTDVVLDPGQKAITEAKIEIFYDATKVELVKDNPILINPSALPKVIAHPTFDQGKISFTLSSNSSSKFLNEKVKIATIYFKAIDTVQRSYIFFGDNTMLFGPASPDTNMMQGAFPEILTISTSSASPQTTSFPSFKPTK